MLRVLRKKFFWVLCLPLIIFVGVGEARKYGLRNQVLITETYPRTQNEDLNWWVSSGGYFTVGDKVGATVQGSLGEEDRFRKLYSRNNPVDTDDGYHPQNIFRLVTERKFEDSVQTVYFRINAENFSSSPNRNASNGVLQMLRYENSNFLYYAGIRVDGFAVIKKKWGGVEDYLTLSKGRVYEGTYDREDSLNANLIPLHKWIGMKTKVQNIEDGSVSVSLWIDREGVGNWEFVLSVVDQGGHGSPLRAPGNLGLRTDFMDVEFSRFGVRELSKKEEE